MKKIINFNFCKYKDLVESNLVAPPESDDKPVEVNDPLRPLLKIIYSIGSDGYPVGDLAYYVGNKSNPEVQRFILENLMQDVSAAAAPASMTLDDDQITALTRRSGESLSQYVQRLNQSVEVDKSIISRALESVSKPHVEDKPAE